jgi:aminoglycoside 6'-N-acetyltransferase I
MKARLVNLEDRSEWLRLLRNLYVGTTDADHLASVDAYFSWRRGEELVPSAVFVVDRPGGGLRGLLELSLRNYAEGCVGETPYIESWFVEADCRGSGIGKLLVEAAEIWARSNGYSEIASDALLESELSHAAHRALGFDEVERAVHFRKSL